VCCCAVQSIAEQVPVCCSVLQCVAVCCSVLCGTEYCRTSAQTLHLSFHPSASSFAYRLTHTATHCTATHCTATHSAVRCSVCVRERGYRISPSLGTPPPLNTTNVDPLSQKTTPPFLPALGFWFHAVCCCVMQCVAVCCRVLQGVVLDSICSACNSSGREMRHMYKAIHNTYLCASPPPPPMRFLQVTTLQHPATSRNTLWHACNLFNLGTCHRIELQSYNALQHSATHCSTLQHTAAPCNTLRHTATHSNTQQHTATHCNTLQQIQSRHVHPNRAAADVPLYSPCPRVPYRDMYVWVSMCTYTCASESSCCCRASIYSVSVGSLCIYIYVYLHIHMHTYMYTNVYIYVRYVYVCVCVCVYAHIHGNAHVLLHRTGVDVPLYSRVRGFPMSLCIYICMHIHTYVHTYICIYICICRYIYIYARYMHFTCICVYVCVCLHVSIKIFMYS